MPTVDTQALVVLATRVAEGLGYELIDLEWKPEAGRWVLRVYVDRLAVEASAGAGGGTPSVEALDEGDGQNTGQGVGLDDCARVSHALGAELDVADLIPVPFSLEVSSPGLNRPLKREAHFQRFIGKKAKVRTRNPVLTLGAESGAQAGEAAGGRRNFTGRIVAAQGGRLRLDVDGQVYEISVDEVEKANLQYEF